MLLIYNPLTSLYILYVVTKGFVLAKQALISYTSSVVLASLPSIPPWGNRRCSMSAKLEVKQTLKGFYASTSKE